MPKQLKKLKIVPAAPTKMPTADENILNSLDLVLLKSFSLLKIVILNFFPPDHNDVALVVVFEQ